MNKEKSKRKKLKEVRSVLRKLFPNATYKDIKIIYKDIKRGGG